MLNTYYNYSPFHDILSFILITAQQRYYSVLCLKEVVTVNIDIYSRIMFPSVENVSIFPLCMGGVTVHNYSSTKWLDIDLRDSILFSMCISLNIQHLSGTLMMIKKGKL